MSISVSAPLAGIGAYAVKAAGEFESLKLALKTTFEDAGRSVAEANEEFKNLQKSAMAPGLDFPQALKASIRLMNVGMSAEKARMTVEELANAVSMSGGSAEDLGEVTNQFSQMIGKGKLLNEDLKIIMGRMPKLASVMKEAFGTTDAEKIRAMGVSAAEFVDTVVNKMKELPRVEGGINNTFVNLGASVRSFAAAIGEDLNKSLNLKKVVEDFSSWLDRLAQSFRELSPSTKEWIVKIGLVAATAGPAIYAISLLTKSAAALKVAFLTARLAVWEFGKAITGAASGVAGLFQTVNNRATFEAFRTKIAATSAAMNILRGVAIGGLIVGLGALAYAIYDSTKSMSAAEKAALNLAEGQKAVQKEAAGEMAAVSQAIAVLKDDKAAKDDRRKAIELLLERYPEYLKGIDIERASISQLDSIQKDLNESILRGVAYRQKANAVNAVYEKQAQAILRIQQLQNGAEITSGEAYGTGAFTPTTIRAAVIEKLQAQVKSLGDEAAKTGQLFDKAFNLGDNANDASGWYAQREKEEQALQGLLGKRTELTEKQIKAAQKAAEAEKAWADEVALHNALGQFKGFDLAKSIKAQTEEAARSTKYLNDQLRELGALAGGEPLPMGTDMNRTGTIEQPGTPGMVQPVMPEMTAIFEDWKAGIASFKETWDATVASVSASGSVMENVFVAGAGALQQYAEQGGSSLKDLANAALGAAAKVIRAQIMQGVTAAAMKALTSVPFPFNIAAAGAAGALAGTLFNKLISSVGIPALAQGGLAYGPTMAMVGDNPGARSNPEVIAPLSKLERIMGGGNMGGTLSTRISGDDLLILLERSGNKRSRSRGY